MSVKGRAGVRKAPSCHRVRLVFVGLISYSLYLWHWPIHVFSNYVSVASPGACQISGTDRAVILPCCFVVAICRAAVPATRRLLPTADLLHRRCRDGGDAPGVAELLFAFHGLPQRFSPEVRRIFAEADDVEPRRHGCFNLSPDAVRAGRVVPGRRHSCFGGDIYSLGRFPRRRHSAGRGCRRGAGGTQRSFYRAWPLPAHPAPVSNGRANAALRAIE